MKASYWRGAFCVLVFALFAAVYASADVFNWTFQQIESYYYDSHQLALAMRTGATWPVAFHNGGGPGLEDKLVASSLTPVGWVSSPLGHFDAPGSYQRARSGQDGRVGAAYFSQGTAYFAQSAGGSWQTVGLGPCAFSGMFASPDLDYMSGNRPVVAYAGNNNQLRVHTYTGAGWESETVTISPPGGTPVQLYGDSPALAVDSLDSPALAYVDGGQVKLAYKSQFSGTWAETTVAPFVDGPASLSLGFGENDEPGLAILSQGRLDYAYFDIPSGTWHTENIATDVASERVNLTFDSQGHPALAYVANGCFTTLAIRSGAGWDRHLLPQGLDPASGLGTTPLWNSEAALAFDAQDVPLISYYADGRLLLAYDPTVPEPTAVLLLVACTALLASRRARP
jgi:hypothetical protein